MIICSGITSSKGVTIISAFTDKVLALFRHRIPAHRLLFVRAPPYARYETCVDTLQRQQRDARGKLKVSHGGLFKVDVWSKEGVSRRLQLETR